MEGSKGNFKDNIVDILLSWRIWALIFFLIISYAAISPSFGQDSVSVNGVSPGSVSEKAGFTFDSKLSQRSHERITMVGSTNVNSLEDYYNALGNYNSDSEFITIRTNKNPSGYKLDITNIGNESLNNFLGLSVRETPSSNIKLGIELEGGSRLILESKDELSEEEFDLLINTLQNRLDVYGASGTKVNKLEDAFSNQKFVIVESISANKNDIFELIKRQGNFEAVLNNKTVFTGDNVLRVDPSSAILEGCSPKEGGEICSYAFSIEIDSEAGDNFLAEAQNLDITNGYLSKKIYFYLDGKEITGLNVASSFKFNKITNPQITVSGSAMPTKQAAIDSARKEMDFLQAILSTQSLPTELNVVQSYSISTSLGQKLLSNALLVGITALFLVSSIVALRYRQIGVFIGIIIALFTEIFIVFGAAAFLKLSIDLAAIGGIIAAIGTGVDDQVIITDEYFRKRKKHMSSRKKVKSAMYIIMISYLTTLAAMVPLYFAGLKILQGFAFTIIIGVTVGVFITRPAYATILRIIMTTRHERKEEDE